VDIEVLAVRGDDTGRLLAAVLEGEEAMVDDAGRLRVAVDGKDAARIHRALG
jgi:hypothetical protein